MGLAFVIGGARCAFEDAAQAYSLAVPDVVIVVNDAIAYWPGKADAAATLHPRYLVEKRWMQSRSNRDYPRVERVFSQTPRRYVTDVIDYMWPEMTFTGSSGHYAVKIALEVFECDRVLCCGVPMDESPHFNDAAPWTDVHRFWEQWELSFPRLSGRVRSMSGRTRALLGEPTGDWLNGADS